MNEKQRNTTPPGMSLDDLLYILFRHKWKILTVAGMGIVAAILLSRLPLFPFESEAKLYIRYVLENKAPSQLSENDTRIKSPDTRGAGIINTELEILTSRDLARQVASAIGPERLLGKGRGNDPDAAAGIVQKGIKAEVPKESSVVRLIFQHNDPGIVQPVLSQLISSYLKKHAEIHGGGAFDDFLTQETDQLRSRLAQTEDALRKAKAKAGVISVDEAKSAFSAQISRIQQQLLDSEAELAERRAAILEMTKAVHPAMTNPTGPPASISYAQPPADSVSDYRRVCSRLESLKRREQDLLLTFTPANSLVKEVGAQIETSEQEKKQLETDYPGLLAAGLADTNAASWDRSSGPRPDLILETARVSSLEAKVKVLTEQLDDVQKRARSVAEAEVSITELQRTRDLEETHYRRFSENLAQSQLDERLGAGKVSNISIIEEPTPAREAQSKLFKLIAVLLLGTIGGAFGLAFLIELYLDQSIRRPAEIEGKLGLPLFLSIPLAARNGRLGELSGGPRGLLAEKNASGKGQDGKTPNAASGVEPAVPKQSLQLRQYYEALRDRLITYFEMKNLTHKPKLVAVTSCAEGSGVSTTAAGLAASLSETGEGSVLLVNMNLQNGAAHRFHRGELACNLEQALTTDQRDQAMVQQNLYVVDEGTADEKLTPVLPKRFKQLVPRLKASDFDYIIFDMPPVSQISVTPRLARFMDVVLMVVESEKTGREVAKRASALLAESNANIGIVLNKGRKYVPQWLKQDL